mmetsp:Transcript_2974/g.8123  ORF Transcript_2974/g.8123 Transcript_2974/m.8123 type:complete len:217 (+) Transcript_2974:210-860(+)
MTGMEEKSNAMLVAIPSSTDRGDPMSNAVVGSTTDTVATETSIACIDVSTCATVDSTADVAEAEAFSATFSKALTAQSVHSEEAFSKDSIDPATEAALVSNAEMDVVSDVAPFATSSAALTRSVTPLSADFKASTALESATASLETADATASIAFSSFLIPSTAADAMVLSDSTASDDSEFFDTVSIADSTSLIFSITSVALDSKEDTALASALAT